SDTDVLLSTEENPSVSVNGDSVDGTWSAAPRPPQTDLHVARHVDDTLRRGGGREDNHRQRGRGTGNHDRRTALDTESKILACSTRAIGFRPFCDTLVEAWMTTLRDRVQM